MMLGANIRITLAGMRLSICAIQADTGSDVYRERWIRELLIVK